MSRGWAKYNHDRDSSLGTLILTSFPVNFIESPSVAFLSVSDTEEVYPMFQDQCIFILGPFLPIDTDFNTVNCLRAFVIPKQWVCSFPLLI